MVEEVNLSKTSLALGVVFILVAGILVGYFVHVSAPAIGEDFRAKSIEDQRSEWLEESNIIRDKLALEGNYRCCLESPCFYCIYKTPKHGEGAACTCEDDILAGVHPCGECIGEILEGHGIPTLAKYFATAIAEEVGTQHLDHLKQIIEEKYEVPVDQQI